MIRMSMGSQDAGQLVMCCLKLYEFMVKIEINMRWPVLKERQMLDVELKLTDIVGQRRKTVDRLHGCWNLWTVCKCVSRWTWLVCVHRLWTQPLRCQAKRYLKYKQIRNVEKMLFASSCNIKPKGYNSHQFWNIKFSFGKNKNKIIYVTHDGSG